MAFKILLVEDDNNLREIYEARLQAEGYEIVTARDGEEALGVAKAEVPDLVISDVMMPRVSGFEMLDILRNTDSLKDVKVIMLTALGQADDKTRANSLGADRYLVKSQVTLEDIVKTAHELLGDATAQPVPASAAAPSAPPVSTMPPAAPGPAVPPVPVTPVAPAPAAPTVAAPPSMPQTFSPTTGASQVPVVPAPPQATGVPVTPPAGVPPLPGVAPAPTPITAPLPTPPAPVAPSTSEEQATIDTQIDNFVHTAPDSTPVADPSNPASQDDAVLADAMQDLAASSMPNDGNSGSHLPEPQLNPAPATPTPFTPQATTPAPSPAPVTPGLPATPAANPAAPMNPQLPPAPMPATPPFSVTPRPITPTAAPEPPAEPEDKPQPTGSVLIANKKIIQPLNSGESKPSINELAAREEANNIVNGTTVPSIAPPATTFSPNAAAPQTPSTGPVIGGPDVTPPPQPPQAPPASSNGFDPNTISL